jgi:hypothetical protein
LWAGHGESSWPAHGRYWNLTTSPINQPEELEHRANRKINLTIQILHQFFMAKLKSIKKVLFLKIMLSMDKNKIKYPDKPRYKNIFSEFSLILKWKSETKKQIIYYLHRRYHG